MQAWFTQKEYKTCNTNISRNHITQMYNMCKHITDMGGCALPPVLGLNGNSRRV